MTVDLSAVKAGDTVKFRCGGKAVVKSIGYSTGSYEIEFDGCTIDSWFNDGSFYGNPKKHSIDIIEIIPAPFDWSDVKQGMGFIVNGNIAEYIGWCYSTGQHVFWLRGDCETYATDSEIGRAHV